MDMVNKSVKKIQFISNYGALYGANRSLLTVIKDLHQKGYFVNVLLPTNGTMADELKKEGISFNIIRFYPAFLYLRPKIKHLIVPLLAFFNLFLLPYILLKVKKFEPDLIYSNTSAENMGFFVARILRIKHITHIREFMSNDHKSYFIFGKRLKRKFINSSDGVIYVSKSVRNAINGCNNEMSQKEIIIYNGLNFPNGLINQNKKLNKTNIHFGIVGLLDPGKDQLKALKYFSRILKIYPEAKLHIFGDGNGQYKKSLEHFIKTAGIEKNVVLHGFLSNVNDIYTFDILFMFSKSEGFGRVTVEAISRGIPVIGYNNAGTAELIQHNKTGFLFNDYKSFEGSVKYLMSSAVVFNEIRRKAFLDISKTCNVGNYSKHVESFIQHILKPHQ